MAPASLFALISTGLALRLARLAGKFILLANDAPGDPLPLRPLRDRGCRHPIGEMDRRRRDHRDRPVGGAERSEQSKLGPRTQRS
jgi:hypothetical protein